MAELANAGIGPAFGGEHRSPGTSQAFGGEHRAIGPLKLPQGCVFGKAAAACSRSPAHARRPAQQRALLAGVNALAGAHGVVPTANGACARKPATTTSGYASASPQWARFPPLARRRHPWDRRCGCGGAGAIRACSGSGTPMPVLTRQPRRAKSPSARACAGEPTSVPPGLPVRTVGNDPSHDYPRRRDLSPPGAVAGVPTSIRTGQETDFK